MVILRYLCTGYIRKTYSEKRHLVNSRYELKQQDNKFCGDISTLFQSHCQTRMAVSHNLRHMATSQYDHILQSYKS